MMRLTSRRIRVAERQCATGLFEEAGELRHHDRHEDDDQPDAGDDQNRRIIERLLHTVAQRFHVREMGDQPAKDFRKCAARLAGGDHVDVKRRKNARKLAHRLGQTAPIDERLVQ